MDIYCYSCASHFATLKQKPETGHGEGWPHVSVRQPLRLVMPPSQDRTVSNWSSSVQIELLTKFREEHSSERVLGERWELVLDGPIACRGAAESINESTHEARRFGLQWAFKTAWGLTIQ